MAHFRLDNYIKDICTDFQCREISLYHRSLCLHTVFLCLIMLSVDPHTGAGGWLDRLGVQGSTQIASHGFRTVEIYPSPHCHQGTTK